MKKILVAFAIILFASLPAAHAQETVWDMANSPQYGKKAGGMFGRGLLNIGTSFVDVIVQTVNGTKNGPPFMGTLTGLGSGIGCTALRLSSGALDVVTFWVPGFNGIPVSRSYTNCLEGTAMDTSSAPAYPEAPQPEAAVPASADDYTRKSSPYDYVKK